MIHCFQQYLPLDNHEKIQIPGDSVTGLGIGGSGKSETPDVDIVILLGNTSNNSESPTFVTCNAIVAF